MTVQASNLNCFRFWALGVALSISLIVSSPGAVATKFQIMGKVTDWKGQNVTNINVIASGFTALNTYESWTNQTDANGKFLLEMAPGWLLDVNVNSEELANRGYRGLPLRTDVSTRSNRVVNFVALSDRPTAHLRGFVRNDFAPVSYNVAANPGWSSLPVNVAAQADGSFDLSVFGGTWYLNVTPFPFQPGVLLPTSSRTIVDGVDLDGVSLEIRSPTARISGDVTDVGHPIKDAWIFASASANGSDYSQSAFTDAAGHFDLDVFDAVWNVEAYWPTAGPLLPIQSISIAGANQTVHFGRSPLNDNFHGHIVDDLGMAVSDVAVFASGPDLSFTQSESDSNGDFSLSLDAGLWQFSFGAPPGLLPPSWKSVFISDSAAPEDETFEMRRTNANLNGIVVDPDSNLVPYAFVGVSSVAEDSMYGAQTYTDEQGQFCFGLFPGEWRINIADSIALRAFTVPPSYMNLKDPQTSLHIVVQPAGVGSHLRGMVMDESGVGLTNATISAFSLDTGEFVYAMVGSGGAFDVLAEFPGAWFLDFQINGVPEGRILLPGSVSLQVEAGVDQDGIILLALAPTAQITGSLENETGQPIPGVLIQSWVTFLNESYGASATTDSAGHFSLPAADGEWLVNVSNWDLNSRGYQSLAAKNVTLESGDEVVNLAAHRLIGDGRVPGMKSALSNNGLIQVRLISQTDSFYEVQASTNLLDWTRMTNGFSSAGFFEFFDVQGTNFPVRFYRARWLPALF